MFIFWLLDQESATVKDQFEFLNSFHIKTMDVLLWCVITHTNPLLSNFVEFPESMNHNEHEFQKLTRSTPVCCGMCKLN
jgi:hypothetical protein